MPVVSKSGCGAEQHDVDGWVSFAVSVLLPAWATYPDLRSSEDPWIKFGLRCQSWFRMLLYLSEAPVHLFKGAPDPVSIFFLSIAGGLYDPMDEKLDTLK